MEEGTIFAEKCVPDSSQFLFEDHFRFRVARLHCRKQKLPSRELNQYGVQDDRMNGRTIVQYLYFTICSYYSVIERVSLKVKTTFLHGN